jgi:hypothetical protein
VDPLRTTDVNQGFAYSPIISKRITLVRKSNCLKPLKLILLNNFCEKIAAKTKTLGIVKMNKMICAEKCDEMGNEHPSFFKSKNKSKNKIK